MSTGTALKQC